MLKIFLMSEVRQPKFRDLVALASMRAASSGRCHKFRCLHLSKMSRVSQEWTGLQHRVHDHLKVAVSAHLLPVVAMWNVDPGLTD